MAQGSMDSDRLSSAGLSTHSSVTVGNGVGSVIGVNAGVVKNEEDYNLGPLPPMWEKAFTPSGEVYFIDHNTGTSHWLDPRLARVRKHSLGECGEDELPYGWERVSDERYGSYYVDHINRRTQYENPVLQARRMRSDKPDNPGGPTPQNVGPPGELQGERFSLTLTKGTQGLGFTLIGAEGVPEMEGYLQIRSIVPHSPAWVDGALRPGDVLVGVGARGVRGLSHAQQAQIFQSIPPNSDVTLHLVRGYPLAFDSGDPHTRVLSTRAVGASSPTQHDARAMQNLTRALRTRFNLESRVDSSPGLDEPDSSPAPPSPTQRRLMSRSFDLDELGTASEETIVPPRCPSADHLLSLTADPARAPISNETGRELVLSLRRGNAGFGFTIADSVHGQKVKKVLDRSRCAGLREGDLLLQIGESDVRHAPHQHVVQVLKDCPALHETIIRVWRRNNAVGRAPRSRSATRPQNNTTTNNLSRSKTPTAEQLRSQTLHAHELHDRLNGMNPVEATYAVPEHKRESLIERRRRNSTPGGRLTVPIVKPYNEQPDQTHWQENEPWLDNSTTVRNWADNNHDWNGNGQKWNQNGDQSQSWNQNGEQTRNWNQNGDQGQNWNQNGDQGQNWNQTGDQGQNWGQNGDHRQNWGQNGDHGQSWGQNGAQGQKWTQNGQGPNQQWNDNDDQGQKWNGAGWSGGENPKWGLNGNWNEVPTPTVNVDMNAAYWRGNASVADSSDNGGFPEDGLLHSPTTAALSGMSGHRQSPANGRLRAHSPNNSGRLRSNSPSLASTTDRLLGNSPTTRMRSQSPSNNSSNDRIKGSPMRLRAESPQSSRLQSGPRRSPSCYETDSLQNNNMYPVHYAQPPPAPGGPAPGAPPPGGPAPDPLADVCVRVSRGPSGFGFRIVGGTEDGSRLAIGHVVPGGPAAGLLRLGDLLTSVDGSPLTSRDATHARAVALVCRAAANGHVTLGIRHNRGDVQPLGLPARTQHPHQPMLADPTMQHSPQAAYNILHPAPVYPPAQHSGPGYPVQYEGRWQSVPYDVTLQRCDTEGFGFVVISSTNKATTSIGQIIPNSPAARCGLLHVGDTILAINHIPIRNLPHPELVGLIKHSGTTLTLTLDNNHQQ